MLFRSTVYGVRGTEYGFYRFSAGNDDSGGAVNGDWVGFGGGRSKPFPDAISPGSGT